jgi:hypothetical protein
LPWNSRIRDAVAEAFLLSIDHFNKGNMKYTWPYYLPSTSTAACTFFEPTVATILKQLRESEVLESCAGTMVKPCSLKHVPLDQFADGEGTPFTLSPRTEANYLSLKYLPRAVEAASSIGVSQLSPREFLEHLSTAISQDPEDFYSRPARWHSQLAATLVRLGLDPDLMFMIMDMRLIPLNDGSWTSAKGQSMFFSKGESSLEIPRGIEVLIVDSTAESDPARRNLFAALGVKAWDASEICRLVLEVHGSAHFKPQALTREQLISHAAFLWKASWQPPKGADLWFVTTQDERCLGRSLYIPGSVDTDSAAAKIFAQLQKKFPVIHDEYLEAVSSDADWPNWLIQNLGLSMIPRLISPHVDPKPQPARPLKAHDDLAPVSKENGKPETSKSFDGDPPSPGHPNNRSGAPDDSSQPTGTGHAYELTDADFDLVFGLDLRQEQVSPTTPPSKNLEEAQNDLRPRGSSDQNHTSEAIVETAKIFDISDEFTFLFRECHTSEVLQLIRDNWQHYSQWIDGAHMKWQSPDFLKSSAELRTSLGSCLVQSARGSLPLQETVLPMLDIELNDGCLIPAVDIKNPSHPDWRLLSNFGVIITADVHYYLRCLISIAEGACPDVDQVIDIYEKIQARYAGSESLIRYVPFNKRRIVWH